MHFSASAVFCFTLSTSTKHFLLRIFFFSGEKKTESTWEEIRWIGRVGHRDHAVLGQKLLNIQPSVGRWTCKSPIMKWANALKESSKKSPKLNETSTNSASWVQLYRWVPRKLTWRGSLYYKGTTLQKIIPLGGSPLVDVQILIKILLICSSNA